MTKKRSALENICLANGIYRYQIKSVRLSNKKSGTAGNLVSNDGILSMSSLEIFFVEQIREYFRRNKDE